MTNEQRETIIEEWIESTEQAMAALKWWLLALRVWQHIGAEMGRGAIEAEMAELLKVGLDGWANKCKAGGGLDALAEAVGGPGYP